MHNPAVESSDTVQILAYSPEVFFKWYQLAVQLDIRSKNPRFLYQTSPVVVKSAFVAENGFCITTNVPKTSVRSTAPYCFLGNAARPLRFSWFVLPTGGKQQYKRYDPC